MQPIKSVMSLSETPGNPLTAVIVCIFNFTIQIVVLICYFSKIKFLKRTINKVYSTPQE